MTLNAALHAGNRIQRHPVAHGLICCLAFAIALCFLPGIALAEDIDTNPPANEFQQRIEETAVAYTEAVEQAKAASDAIEENELRIKELERRIPLQQRQGEAAMRELYKIQRQRSGIVELLLGSESFFDFLSNLEYVDRVTAAQRDQIQLLIDMKKELDAKRADLTRAKNDAEIRAAEAKDALAAAQAARVDAQQKAQSAARQTVVPSASNVFSNAPSDVVASSGEAVSPAKSADDSGEPEQASDPVATEESTVEVEIVDDGADWMSEEDVFVNEWAARIDAYLAGSPLYGYGAAFARAAWNYGVDPRWSPAISCTESTKGAYCFLPHNAWGWGSVSWGSWEEAIDAHVRGLARGYGYTISWEAACKYCPPNAEHWYNFTLSEMNRI